MNSLISVFTMYCLTYVCFPYALVFFPEFYLKYYTHDLGEILLHRNVEYGKTQTDDAC